MNSGSSTCSNRTPRELCAAMWKSSISRVQQPNGSRLSCGRPARRRKGVGRQSVPRQGNNTPLPLKRLPPVSFKRLLGRSRCTVRVASHVLPCERDVKNVRMSGIVGTSREYRRLTRIRYLFRVIDLHVGGEAIDVRTLLLDHWDFAATQGNLVTVSLIERSQEMVVGAKDSVPTFNRSVA